MNCDEALAQLDRYLDGEGAEAVAGHLAECPACSQEADARRAFRKRLRQAVRAASPAASADLTRAIHERTRPSRRRLLTGIAAAAGVAVAGGLAAYRSGYLAFHDAYYQELEGFVPVALRPGLEDHIHCALYRDYRKAEGNVLPPRYRDLVPVVERHFADGFQLYEAHECMAGGHRFVHVILGSSQGLVSVMLLREGQAFPGVPAMTRSGIAFYQARAQRFAVAGFASHGYHVYLVSEMADQQSLERLALLAPDLDQVLSGIG